MNSIIGTNIFPGSKASQLLLIQVVLAFFVSLQFVLNSFYEFVFINEMVLKVELISIYLYCILSSITIIKWTHLYMLFLFTFGVFILTRVFLDVFSGYNFLTSTFLKYVKYSMQTRYRVLQYLILFLTFLNLGFLSKLSRLKLAEPRTSDITNMPVIEYWAKLLFVFTFLITFYKYILMYKYVMVHGYWVNYSGELDALAYPWWTKGMATLNLAAYGLLLSSMPRKKVFLQMTSLLIVLKFLLVLKGGRIDFLVTLFFATWYYYRFYIDKKLPIVKIAVVGLCLIIFSQYVVSYRQNFENSTKYNQSIGDAVFGFFWQQGISINILATAIEFEDELPAVSYPYVFYPFHLFADKSQSINTITSTSSSGDHIAYFLNKKDYFFGIGIGSSFLFEIYFLGLFLFILSSFFIGYLLCFFHFQVIYSRILMLLSFPIIFQIIRMPRYCLLPDLLFLIWSLLLYFLFVSMLYKTINKND